MTEQYWTISEAAKLLSERRISPTELIDECLSKISDQDSVIRSFCYLLEEDVRKQAKHAEIMISSGSSCGLLHGIPIGIKDVIETRGIPTTAYSKLLANHVPDTDSICARNLLATGAIMMGKLATHEFAMGGPSFDLPRPPARNPWNPRMYTGGSSSGPGAAVAAGFVLGALGTDTGGSIRLPSSLCGLAGLKPTYGLVSCTGVVPLAFSLDHVGPMAWTSRDCAILLDAIYAKDRQDSLAVKARSTHVLSSLNGDLRGIRIGVLVHSFSELPVGTEVNDAINRAQDVLKTLGAELIEEKIADLADYHAAATIIMLSEAFSIYGNDLRSRWQEFGASFRHRVMPGATIAAHDYVTATRWRRLLTQDMEGALKHCDALLLPTTSSTAGPIESVTPTAFFERPSFTAPANVTGLPALSICCGFDSAGLPIGMQLIGRRYQESSILKIGDAYENATTWRNIRPKPLPRIMPAASYGQFGV